MVSRLVCENRERNKMKVGDLVAVCAEEMGSPILFGVIIGVGHEVDVFEVMTSDGKVKYVSAVTLRRKNESR